MIKILKKDTITDSIKVYELEVPEIARKAKPGQFVIIRVDEKSERVPLTIADFDRDKVNGIFRNIHSMKGTLLYLDLDDLVINQPSETKGDIFGITSNTDRFYKHFPDFKFTCLEDGIKKMVEHEK